MNDKVKVWSDGSERGYADDIVHSLGEEKSLEVDEKIVRRGAVLMCNCQTCGRQIKAVLPWGEIAMLFVGQPVQGTRQLQDGILVAMGCPCMKTSPLKIEADELRRWVDLGVRSGALKPEIYRARAR